MVDRVAGLDMHKRTVTVCVRTPDGSGGRREQKRTFPTYYGDLCEMRDWLVAESVALVVMEATGVFWKPPWMVLEDIEGVELRLVNARHVHQVPGRKTDVGDAAWLAQLAEVGLLSGSFVPDREIRDLRDLTRYRTRLVQDRTREGQRVEKALEDAGVKLASVASRTLGKSGRAMLDALIAGERDPEVLAGLAQGRLKARSGDLARALAGQVRDHHVRMLQFHLGHIDALNAMIADLDSSIDDMVAPYVAKTERLRTIPGIGLFVAIVILAECGLDMASFPTPAHLASWAAFCPGNNESGGKHRSGKTRHANAWLADALTKPPGPRRAPTRSSLPGSGASAAGSVPNAPSPRSRTPCSSPSGTSSTTTSSSTTSAPTATTGSERNVTTVPRRRRSAASANAAPPAF